MAKKVFVSYKSNTEDTTYKNLLVAWSKSDKEHFDLKFNDTSVGVSINSANAAYIKSVIKARIKDSKVFLMIIGKNTHKSEWCSWEIEKAVELNKKIVAVKIDSDYTTPSGLYGIGTKFVGSFKYESIKKAIDD
ncbi:hypothetical protein BTO30_02695 [Domibacillus antri]|uniref:Thoeris protein ThsB TIR-like domain-containing protein n=1 Tax=Domibacillus antri TaxID=1714264 RepID=A0A1Q8Q953_9BACI|nr:TIR domain-containing protein [Domibacillus antri]OLN23867.1 hypothetical protein BTO30_02695 [Domibacillus antri]